jgi:hypothetical protein
VLPTTSPHPHTRCLFLTPSNVWSAAMTRSLCANTEAEHRRRPLNLLRLGVIGISQCHHGLYDAKPRPFLWLPSSSRSRRSSKPPHQDVHLPSLAVAVPSPECVTTAWRPGHRRPREFLFCIDRVYSSPEQADASKGISTPSCSPFACLRHHHLLSSAALFILFSGR